MIRPPPSSTLFPPPPLSRFWSGPAAPAPGSSWPTHPPPAPRRPDGWSGVAAATLPVARTLRSEEHTSELHSRLHLVCRLLLEKKKINPYPTSNACYVSTQTY